MFIKAFNQLGSVQQCIVLSTQHIGFFKKFKPKMCETQAKILKTISKYSIAVKAGSFKIKY